MCFYIRPHHQYEQSVFVPLFLKLNNIFLVIYPLLLTWFNNTKTSLGSRNLTNSPEELKVDLGTVTFFSIKAGYGFVKLDNGRSCFFSYSEIQNINQLKALKIGQTVELVKITNKTCSTVKKFNYDKNSRLRARIAILKSQ